MGTGYTRQSAASIATGLTVEAADLNAEFNALQSAFDATTGHSHDGTSGEGPKIALTTGISGVLPVANGGYAAIHKTNATAAPTANDDSGDGYGPGSVWVDVTNDNIYFCLDATLTAAVWERMMESVDSSTDNTVPRFNGTGGELQTSGVVIDDDNNIFAFGDIYANYAAGNYTVKLDQTGIVLKALLDISGAAAGQIQFPASQNASADANTLDDYEEGTWTPTFTTDGVDFDSVTYDAATAGRYTKIGRMVFIEGFIRTDALTVGSGSGNVVIGGLPFSANATTLTAANIGQVAAFGGDMPSAGVCSGTTIFLYYKTTANGAHTTLLTTDMGTGANANSIRFSAAFSV